MQMAAPLEIAISCADMERMIAFYCDVLGCTLFDQVEVPPAVARTVPLARAGYRVCRLQTTSGERIKFVEPKQPRAAVPPSAPGTDPESDPESDGVMMREHAFYLTFIVEDLDALLEALRTKGVELMAGGGKTEIRRGFFIAFAHDPEGNVLEFNQYADLAGYRPDLDQWRPLRLPAGAGANQT
jgi:catechol 2,3-dioxygenase-like lactoylglutathione lyase family enzyme